MASRADESILTDGKVDLGILRPIIFGPSFSACRVVGEVVGKAFSGGLKLKQAMLHGWQRFIRGALYKTML